MAKKSPPEQPEELQFCNGDIVRYQGEPHHVVGRSEDRTYTLGRRTATGWEQLAHEVPEGDLAPTTLVEHHYNGVMIGHIEAEELARIHEGRRAGTIIGLGEPSAALTLAEARRIVAAADAGTADDGR